MTQPRAGDAPYKEILVPIEGSTQEYVVQEHAVELAASLGVPLKAVHVESQVGADFNRFQYIEELCWRRKVPFEKRVLRSEDVVGELVDEASPGTLIVVGTRLLGSEYHLGSVTEGLVHRAPCPVEVVRLQAPHAERPPVRPSGAARKRS